MTAAHFASMDEDTADLLHLVADVERPTGRDAVTAFLDACKADAAANDGRVSVSRVAEMLPEDITSTERYSSFWSQFTGPGKPMQKIPGEVDVRTGSKSGNTGRMGPARRWVG